MLDTVQTMYTCLQEQAEVVGKSKVSKNAVSQETYAEIAKEKVYNFIFFLSHLGYMIIFLWILLGSCCIDDLMD